MIVKDNQMRWTRGQKGVTLVELMITLVIFTIVISMIYSVFNAFIKQATSERKTAKTEMDVINVSWPLLKEIQTAGFGVPKTGTCTPAISESGGVLTIHSTASGDSQYAGKWGYVGTGCVLSTTDIPSTENVVVINNTDRSRLGLTTVNVSNALSTCDTNYINNVAYWTKTDGSGTKLECYRTDYSLRTYDPASSKPATCANGTQKLSRRVSTDTADLGNYQPMLDCVLDLAYRFGCINSSGNLTWQAGTDCGTSKLRLMKVGIVIQSSTRRDILSPETITLFEDLDSLLRVTLNLTPEQRNYKWRKIEQTIVLKNLE